MHIAGRAIANLVASTTGTDADWVVKLIDVYPDEVAGDPEMGGYQLMIAMDIFRGRYRESFAASRGHRRRQAAQPTASPCRTTNHVFLPGHRIMVQVQSSWFPLYDRNPQTYRAEHLLGQARAITGRRPSASTTRPITPAPSNFL